jgi:hypothetical protein
MKRVESYQLRLWASPQFICAKLISDDRFAVIRHWRVSESQCSRVQGFGVAEWINYKRDFCSLIITIPRRQSWGRITCCAIATTPTPPSQQLSCESHLVGVCKVNTTPNRTSASEIPCIIYIVLIDEVLTSTVIYNAGTNLKCHLRPIRKWKFVIPWLSETPETSRG